MRSSLRAGLMALLVCAAVPVTAQSIASTSETWPPTDAAAEASRPLLQQPARLQVERVPLLEGLDELQRRSGVALAFSPSLLPGDVRVSCECERATVGQALATLLQGTSYRYSELGRQVVIEPRQEPARALPSPTQAARAYLASSVAPTPAPAAAAPAERRAARQRGSVTGQVVEAGTMRPLSGAQVNIAGTGIGAITNASGRFLLVNVPVGTQTVRVRLVGYAAGEQTVSVREGESVTANFELSQQAIALDEVVVTALGIEREAYTLGYSTQTVQSEDLAATRSGNWVNALQGQVAGLSLTNAGTGVMGTTRITLRGENTLDLARNEALIVVDGVPINNRMASMRANSYLGAETPIDFGDGISNLNPDDIESVTVLKGPSAAALYGSRAANGAIIITTKRATQRRGLGITYSGGTTYDRITRWPDFQMEYGSGSRARLNLDYYSFNNAPGRTGNHSTHSWGLPLRGQMFHQYVPGGGTEVMPWMARDFIKGYFQTGVTYNHNVSVSNTSELGSFRLSYSNRDNSWIVPNTGTSTHSLDLNSRVRIADNLHVNATGRYIHRGSDNLPAAGYGAGSPMYFFTWNNNSVDVNWLRNYWIEPGVLQDNTINPNSDNPWFQAYEMIDTQDKGRLIGAVSLDFNPTSRSHLMLRTGRDQSEDFRTTTRPWSSVSFPRGMYREQTVSFQESNTDFLFSYEPQFNGVRFLDDLQTKLSVGGNYRHTSDRDYMITAEELVLPGVYNLGNSAIRPLIRNSFAQSEMYSLYSMLTLGRHWWNLDLTARNDWSSTLAPENNSYFYPSAALSIIPSELFDMGNAVDFAKVRLAVSQVGNSTTPYRLDKYYSFHAFDGSLTNPNSIPNADLKPEIVTSYEGGFDVRLFRGRLSLDATVYHSESVNQILNVPIDPSTGFTSALLNAGQINNRGVEVIAGFSPVRTRNFQWNSRLNWAANRSEVIELAEGVDNYIITSGISNRVFVEARPGERFGNIYGRGYLRSPDGQIVHDNNGYPMMGEEFILTGNAYPDWTGGLSNTLTYRGVRLNSLFDFRKGGDIYSLTYAALSYSGKLTNSLPGRYDGNITPTGVVRNPDGSYSPNTRRPVNIGWYYDALYNRDNVEANTLDTSFLKLREVSLSYDLPQRFIRQTGAQGATLSLTGRNLFTWSSFPSYDPEAATLNGSTVFPGLETGQFPGTTSVGFNVQLSF